MDALLSTTAPFPLLSDYSAPCGAYGRISDWVTLAPQASEPLRLESQKVNHDC